MSRPLVAHFSTAALLHNLSVIKAQAPSAKILAMVKANAYGHGAVEVATRLQNSVDGLGVASIDEALVLRNAGIVAPITLVEGVFSAEEIPVAAEQNFAVVFHSSEQIAWMEQVRVARPVTAWLKIDSGMGRLGFCGAAVEAAYARLCACAAVQQPVGMMAHYARADEPRCGMNVRQDAAFDLAAQKCGGEKSVCNSAGIFAFTDRHFDWVRPGLALYGASPLDDVSAEELGLLPVMTLRSAVIAVREMKAGDSVGYGACFTCPEEMRVGIAAAGYGDGVPRLPSQDAAVLIDGAPCPVLGRVSMDMMAVDLRPAPQAQSGSPVVLWGEEWPVENWAEAGGASAYEILTGLQKRVASVWD